MKKITIAIVLLLFATTSLAGDYAVRLDCPNNGDGSSWNCGSGAGFALNTLPNTLVRGDTYYLSKGSIVLSYYELNVPESGTSKITIKKATDTDHGPSSGWVSSIGNAQTIFSSSTTDVNYNGIFNIYNGTDYYVFNGAYGSGPDPNDYGFKFVMGTTPPPNDTRLFYGGNGTADYQEFYYCAFVGPYPDKTKCSSAIDGGGTNSLIQYCLFQGFDNPVHGFTNDLTIDNSWFTKIWGGGDTSCHGQQLSYNGNRLIIKNSVFLGLTAEQNGLTATITFNDASGTQTANDWLIYNNVFIDNQWIILATANGGSSYGMNRLRFFNNTIVGDGNGGGGFNIEDEGASDNQIKSNLFYNASIGLDGYALTNNTITHDYNYWDSTCTNRATETNSKTETISKTNLFVDPDKYNYHLKYGNLAISNSVDLGAPFNVDKDGVTRPEGGGWDIGAYEYFRFLVSPQNFRMLDNP